MKKHILIAALVALTAFSTNQLIAQNPPPPPSEGHGQTGNSTNGGGAPVSGGLGILITLGVAYGAKNIYSAFQRKEKLEE